MIQSFSLTYKNIDKINRVRISPLDLSNSINEKKKKKIPFEKSQSVDYSNEMQF